MMTGARKQVPRQATVSNVTCRAPATADQVPPARRKVKLLIERRHPENPARRQPGPIRNRQHNIPRQIAVLLLNPLQKRNNIARRDRRHLLHYAHGGIGVQRCAFPRDTHGVLLPCHGMDHWMTAPTIPTEKDNIANLIHPCKRPQSQKPPLEGHGPSWPEITPIRRTTTPIHQPPLGEKPA